MAGNEIAGWSKSPDSYDTARIGALREAVGRGNYPGLQSIVVVKDEKLLLEMYFREAGRNQLHDVRSVGKTFASALLGIAIREGYIRGVGATLADFYELRRYEHFDPRKERVSLRHLLTMSSGFDGDDFEDSSIGNEENMYPTGNWVAWTLNLPMAPGRNPGEEWHYFTAGVVVLGDILNRHVPGGLEQYADQKLFKPLGIHRYAWKYTPQGVPSTAGGIKLRPLDLARFGQLYLNGGRWRGRQIIARDWVAASLQQYHTTRSGEHYGYLWWNKKYNLRGTALEAYYCSGNGGNKIFIFPETNLVVVVTADAYDQDYAHKQVDELMEKYVLPAVLGA